MCPRNRASKQKEIVQPCALKVHAVQSSDTVTEKKGKPQCQKNWEKTELDILTELREMRLGVALLKDLSTEVSQIRESIKQPQVMSTQCPPPVTDDANISSPQVQYLPPGYWQPYDEWRVRMVPSATLSAPSKLSKEMLCMSTKWTSSLLYSLLQVRWW